MYYHLQDHIYIAQFRDEYIILDSIKDQYIVCSRQISNTLENILQINCLFDSHNVSNLSRMQNYDLVNLEKQNIVESKAYPYPFYIDKKATSLGVANVDWELPLVRQKTRFSIQVLNAFIMLCKVHFNIKYQGFYKTIQKLKTSRDGNAYYYIPTDNDVNNLANILNKACVIYPKRTKCLEWAVTFVLLALKRGWKCNLEIGVQNYPFYAHAWVECGGKTVMDDQSLRDGLAIILNEPFRRRVR